MAEFNPVFSGAKLMLNLPRSETMRKVLAVLLLSTAAFAGPRRAEHLTGIAHIALHVPDLQASLRFYQLLGFERAFEFTSNGTASEEFLKVNDRQFIELYPMDKPGQHAGLMHVCFESDDLAGLRQAYIAGGLSVPEIKRGGAGNDLFSLTRPDGSVIEFTQYQPGSMHMKDRGLHLGANRLSDGLAEVIEPVSHPGAAVAFYRERLGLETSDKSTTAEVSLPSDAHTRLGFAPSGTPLRMVFLVSSLQQTKSTLRKLGSSYSEVQSGIVVKDPDGNEVMFTERVDERQTTWRSNKSSETAWTPGSAGIF